MLELRPYQEECIARILDAYKHNPYGRELVVLPCASGKTVIFSHVIDTLARGHGVLALVVCHLDELLDQAAEKYRMVKPDAVIGKVGSGLHQYGGELTVAGIQTISRAEHLKRLKSLYGSGNKLIIVLDEAHLSAVPSYQRLLSAFPEAFVLLVTATPYRLDGRQIIDKPPLYQKTIIEMIQSHYLCDLRAVAIRTNVNLNEVGTRAGDFNEHELDLAVNTPARNRRIVQAYQEHTPHKRALAFCVTVAHAEALAYAFNDMGVSAAVVSGETALPERKKLYQAFERGEILVLTTVNVLSIGFDSPKAEVAIMARPTQSQALFVQQVGRILRLAPNKKHGILLDITDNSLRLRVAPQHIHSALGFSLLENETLLEAVTRTENENAEREAREKRAIIRKLNERREKDVVIDLFALPEWQEHENGLYVLEIGLERHRIAIAPCPSNGWAQLYDVFARLAPDFRGQKWISAQPLDRCLQEAEKRARMLLSGEVELFAKRSHRWQEPITERQQKYLDWKKIPWTPDMTKAEASRLIDEDKQKVEARKAKKAERTTKMAAHEEARGDLYSQPFSLLREG